MAVNNSREDVFEKYIKEANLEGTEIAKILRKYAKCNMPLYTICRLNKFSERDASLHVARAFGEKKILIGSGKRCREIIL
jgi:hypothetical protein